MRAIVPTSTGGPEVLAVAELPDPIPGPGEVLIDVAAAGVNRADLLQRMGLYPPPSGASDVIGLECSGTIGAVGEGVTQWTEGDEVCALLAGGGYASRVVVPAGQVMPVPDGVDLVTAAALPEAACTVWSNVFMIAGLRPEETLLVHGGAGGIGTIAIQLAKALGARVVTTASAAKLDVCRGLGADVAVDYTSDDFVERAREATGGGGVDVIVDNMGAKYLERNLEALALNGRLIVIGMQGGTRAELDLAKMLARRLAVVGSTLRSRPVAEKAAVCTEVVANVWPLVGDRHVRPVVHAVLPLEEAAEAHRALEAGAAVGKILLTA